MPALASLLYVAFGSTVVLLLCTLFHLSKHRRDLQAQIRAITEQRKEDKLQLSARSQLDTIKDEFISTVSHELRTPLTSIRGSLGLLSSGTIGNLDPKAQNLLRIAVTNTDRLIRLINDILDLERMASGRAPLQIRRCSLLDLVDQAIETMTGMADSAMVHLLRVNPTTDPAGDTLYFDGDADRILQVLTNLLSNAIKFSPDASTVRIQMETTSESIVVKVSDEGRGIPPDKLDSIFDRFGQIEPADAKQKGGTGLGLAICRSIVQQHSGSIWAQRNLGPGTTISVMLPRTARSSDILPPKELSLEPGNGSVLVCDDDPGIRAVVAETLLRQGYAVVEASSGQEAIELAEKHAVSAILLDLYMPGLSGWETLQRLRNQPTTSSIPVVVLSVLSPLLRTEVAGDAQGWVQKPFNAHLLFSELSRVLHRGEGPAHVLLVEDDDDLASVVIASFGEADVHVDHANTRQQAIRRCLIRRPDLLILDLTLPDGDGFSFVEWIREQPRLRTLPLVVYSGREISEGERSKLRLGPTEFLTKAKVQPREVEALVLSMVQRLRSTSAASSSPDPFLGPSPAHPVAVQAVRGAAQRSA